MRGVPREATRPTADGGGPGAGGGASDRPRGPRVARAAARHWGRSFFQQRLGHDLNPVRVHTGDRAAASARAVDARAYTVGSDIVFGANEYAPSTPSGQHLLAHELAHVAQQRHGPTGSPLRIQPANDPLETQAESVAKAALAGGRPSTLAGAGSAVARQAPAPAPAAPAPAAPAKIERKTVTIQPVAVANDDGKSPTAIPSFADAKTIWGKCCIDLTVNATKQVDKTNLKELEAPLDCAPKNEAKTLADTAAIGGKVISVFVPDTFKDGADVGKNVHGGGFATNAGTDNPKLFIVSGAHGTVVAHELGHAMGHASCLGKKGHEPTGTVMEPSGAHDKAVKTKVAADICTNVRGYAGATASGTPDCTQDLT